MAEVITKTGGSDAVQPAAAPPGGHDADAGAEQEGQDRGHADQAERPRHGVQDDPADRLRVEVQRGAEVPGGHVAQVVEVLPEQALRWCSTPKAASRALSACGFTGPRNLPIMASAGLPGISRGRKKFSVSAAHKVIAKKPSRRSANLMSCSWLSSGPPFRLLAGPARCSHSHGHPRPGRPASGRPGHGPAAAYFGDRCSSMLPPVGVVVGGGLGVRVALGGPAGEVAGVVLEPVHLLGDRDDRHVLSMTCSQLVDDRVLLGRAGRVRRTR